MKKFFVTIFCSLLFCGLFAQNQPSLSSLPEAYVELPLQSPAQLQQLAHQFSVDKVMKNNGTYQVRLWLGPLDVNLGVVTFSALVNT